MTCLSSPPRPLAAGIARTAIALLCALTLVTTPLLAQTAAPTEAGMAGPRADRVEGAESPEAVIEAMKAAAESEDFGGVMAMVVPEERVFMTSMLMMSVGMAVAFAGMGAEMIPEVTEDMSPEERQEIEQAQEQVAALGDLETRFTTLLESYGLSEEAMDDDTTDMDALLAEVDQVGLIVDLMTLLESMPGSEDGDEDGEDEAFGGMASHFKNAELQDLQIDGDRATGRIQDEDVTFLRIDGRWYASLGMDDAMGGMEGAMEEMEMEMEMDDAEMEMEGEMEGEDGMDGDDDMDGGDDGDGR